jgi:UDP-2,3-diacylglucosamine hydrolase
VATFFISDLHLSPERPAITAAFEQFLAKTAKGADALYILGDFVDAWIGDDDDSPFVEHLKTLLANYASTGTPVFFMRGNRDFLIGEGFADAAHVQILPEPSAIDLYGTRIVLMHGDSLCTRDAEYMQFRQQVRSDAWQQQVLALPLEHRRQMAADLRAKSKSMSSMKAEDIMDVTPEEVVKVLEEYGVKTLIHGHTHRPNRHALAVNGAPGERIVLGDWEDRGWYLKATPEATVLVDFEIPQPSQA